jgi:hypothetical protein
MSDILQIVRLFFNIRILLKEHTLFQHEMGEQKGLVFLFCDEARLLNIRHGELASFQKKGNGSRLCLKISHSDD